MRGKAMSAAPICIGTSQFAKPTKAGMIAPNTITRPCTVVSELKNCPSKNCSPGWKSSARIISAMVPPMKNMVSANQRYMVPMSLWFVVYIQRVNPAGGRTARDGGRVAGRANRGVDRVGPGVELVQRVRFGEVRRGRGDLRPGSGGSAYRLCFGGGRGSGGGDLGGGLLGDRLRRGRR